MTLNQIYNFNYYSPFTMSDAMLNAFLGEGIEEGGNQYQPELITVKIEKVTVEQNFEVTPNFIMEKALVYHFIDANKNKFTKADSMLKKDGNPVKNWFRDMNWYNDSVIRATYSYDIKECVKAALGNEKYEELKKANGGKINSKMFIGVKFDVEYKEGEKDGNKYRIYTLPLESKYKYWKYLFDQGTNWNEIDEVREYFNLDQKSEAMIEETLVDESDLPF